MSELSNVSTNPLLPWYDQVDWMADPAYAYLKGLQDGYRLGWSQGLADLDRAVARMLSDGTTEHPGDAVSYHQRRQAEQAARAAADRQVRPDSRVADPAASWTE